MTCRVLVTGREGQLARSLAARAAVHPDFDLVFAARPELDLSRPETIARAIRAVSPQIVVSAAAYTAVDQAETDVDTAHVVNAEAPGVLAEAAGAVGAPILHLSTDYVYDGEKPGPYVESDPTCPQNIYGRTKLAGEEAVRASTPDHLILRTAWVHSPYGRNFVKTMLRVAETTPKLRVVDDQCGSPTGALDIADAILAIASKWAGGAATGLGRTYHCACRGETTWAGFARHVFASSRTRGGPFAEVEGCTTADYPTPARRPANSRLDVARLEADFRISMAPWEASVDRTLALLLGNG